MLKGAAIETCCAACFLSTGVKTEAIIPRGAAGSSGAAANNARITSHNVCLVGGRIVRNRPMTMMAIAGIVAASALRQSRSVQT
jgi:hypothetical protein